MLVKGATAEDYNKLLFIHALISVNLCQHAPYISNSSSICLCTRIYRIFRCLYQNPYENTACHFAKPNSSQNDNAQHIKDVGLSWSCNRIIRHRRRAHYYRQHLHGVHCFNIYKLHTVLYFTNWPQRDVTAIPQTPVNSSPPSAVYMSVNWVSIGWDNGFSPIRYQAII